MEKNEEKKLTTHTHTDPPTTTTTTTNTQNQLYGKYYKKYTQSNTSRKKIHKNTENINERVDGVFFV